MQSASCAARTLHGHSMEAERAARPAMRDGDVRAGAVPRSVQSQGPRCHHARSTLEIVQSATRSTRRRGARHDATQRNATQRNATQRNATRLRVIVRRTTRAVDAARRHGTTGSPNLQIIRSRGVKRDTTHTHTHTQRTGAQYPVVPDGRPGEAASSVHTPARVHPRSTEPPRRWLDRAGGRWRVRRRADTAPATNSRATRRSDRIRDPRQACSTHPSPTQGRGACHCQPWSTKNLAALSPLRVRRERDLVGEPR